jgi:hypothetical protein
LFKLTAQAFKDLQIAMVLEPVLVKLYPLKNKDFSRGALMGEINKILNTDEMKQFQSIILNDAQIAPGQ